MHVNNLGRDKRIVWNAETIKGYEKMQGCRNLRTSKVSDIGAAMLRKEPFLAPIIVMESARPGGKLMLFDGMHRFEGVKYAIRIDPKFSIDMRQITIPHSEDAVFKNDLYRNIQKITKFTIEDQFTYELKYNAAVIKLVKNAPYLIENKRKDYVGFQLKRLLMAYFTRNSTIGTDKKENYIDLLHKLTDTDIQEIYLFMKCMVYAFDDPRKGHPAYNSSAFLALAKLFFQNRKNGRTADHIAMLWKRKIKDTDQLWTRMSSMLNTAARRGIATYLLDLCNAGLKNNKFTLYEGETQRAAADDVSPIPSSAAPQTTARQERIILPGGQLLAPPEPKISDDEIERRAQLRQQFNGNRRF